MNSPWLTPVYVPGKEPLPPGMSEEDRQQMQQLDYWSKFGASAMESCPVKFAISGVAGFGLGAFFQLFSAALSADDPMRRTNLYLQAQAAGLPEPKLTTMESTKELFKDTGRQMYRSGKGFAKIGALYSGIECCIEAYRAKNDIQNSIYAGGLAGAILARNSGVKAMVFGGIGFAAFSSAIDMYLRREPADEP